MFTFCFICAVLVLICPSYSQWAPIIKISTNEVNTGLCENMGQSIVAIQNFVHVIWFDMISTNESAIIYKRSVDGNWENDTRLSPPGLVLDGVPLMAACGSYVHVVYWRNPYNSLDNTTGPPTQSYYKRSNDSGVTWQKEVLIGNFTYWPGLACSGSNVFITVNNIVTWTPYNTEIYFMSSFDNGTNWNPIFRISNAVGRSEDPAMSASGPYIYIAWNDNRLDQTHLQLYFRASNDSGQNWGPETALTALPNYCYSPTVNAEGNIAHVFFANFGVSNVVTYLKSIDGGNSFGNLTTITNVTGSRYESAVADQENVHVIFSLGLGAGNNYYVKSSDGGATWPSTSLPIATFIKSVGYSPASFVSVLGNVVHLVWSTTNATGGHNAIYYTNNPTGNVQNSTNIQSSTSSGSPASGSATTSGSPASGSATTSGSPSSGSATTSGSPASGSATTSGSPSSGSATTSGSPPIPLTQNSATVHSAFLCGFPIVALAMLLFM